VSNGVALNMDEGAGPFDGSFPRSHRPSPLTLGGGGRGRIPRLDEPFLYVGCNV